MATQTTDAISQRRSPQNGGCLVLFGLVFLLIGSAAFFFTFVRPVQQIIAAKSWVATPCTISSSQVASSRDSDGTTYKVEVAYSYVFKDQSFIGDRYSFATGSSSSYSDKQSAVAAMPPGSTGICYVDPNNPAESVIFRGMPRDTWFSLFTLIFIIAGAAICFAGLKMNRNEATPRGRTDWRPKSAPLGSNSPAAPPLSSLSSPSSATGAPSPFQDISASRERVTSISGPGVPASYGSQATMSGPIALKPRASRVGTFIFLLLFGAFWNGIISVGVRQAFRGGSGDIFLGLFMIPFVLVGLGLIGATIYQFLALFGPRLEVTASAPNVALGGTLDISWKMKTRLQNVTRMHLFLEGREEATYRRGTDTYTDKNTFTVLDIADLQSHEAMREGSARVTIPPHLMHSFEAPNNKILWLLVAKGEIPIWPDLKEEYPIAVLPQAVN